MKSTIFVLFGVFVGCYAAFSPLSRLNIPTNMTNGGKVWALLVAGSNTYGNYRHQADVCHAYQIIHDHGIPDENIVVMMFDDIAYNKENPNQGSVINKPDGPNVYKNVLKDYTGKEVTPENFLKILKGDKSAMSGIGSGKVIESTENDYVFVNMVDHGGVGIFAFPNYVMLHKDDLQTTLEDMYKEKKYKQMVVYMEACESGSMFDDLPSDINIFATTASNARESSYACYYDSALRTYLGDVYSIKWMEDVDKAGTLVESLEEQFERVKKETTTSHVSQYGQMSFDSEKLSMFMGSVKVAPQSPGKGCDDKDDAVPSYDAPIALLYKQISETEDEQERSLLEIRLMKELASRQEIRSVLERVAVSVTGNAEGGVQRAFGAPLKLTQTQCRRNTYNKYFSTCPRTDYAIKHAFVLSNLCEMGVLEEDILSALGKVC